MIIDGNTRFMQNNRTSIPTKTGFDHENNAPDKAKDTQSTGVPGIKNEKIQTPFILNCVFSKRPLKIQKYNNALLSYF